MPLYWVTVAQEQDIESILPNDTVDITPAGGATITGRVATPPMSGHNEFLLKCPQGGLALPLSMRINFIHRPVVTKIESA
ncbi:MAG: hypothetical protein IPN71_17030 [Fibrobacteres bacterium]|nr:hypothetical protein [Fibrobacterota bacterium]